MERWLRETRQAARILTGTPGFSVTVVAVFVISVAIATSVWSLGSTIFGQAVPFANADRLVNLHELNRGQGIDFMENSWPTYRLFEEQATAFETLGLLAAPNNLTLTTDEGGQRIVGGLASPSVFEMMGVEMALGRPFGTAEEGYGTAARSVVLGYDFWSRRFGADPAVVGTSVLLNGTAWSIVGVLPPHTPLLPTVSVEVDAWLPAGQATAVYARDISQDHSVRVFTTLGLVREGVSPDRLDAEVAAISRRISEAFPETSRGWEWTALKLSDVVTARLRGPAMTMVSGAIVLLLVAITNVLGLFGQRARSSARAATVRLAIGGTRDDLTRIATTEAAVLIVPGTLFGIAVGALALKTYTVWTPFPLPPHMQVGLDAWAVTATLAVALVTVALIGRVTGWWLSRIGDSDSGLRTPSLGGRTGWRAARFGLGMQVALTALLTATGLLTARSFASLIATDIGFDPDNLLISRIDVPAELRPTDELTSTADEILERLRTLPGVERAALWAPHVPAQAIWTTRVVVFDRPDLQEPADQPLVRIHMVGPEAATTLGLRFVAGRDFTLDDRTSRRRVAIVSETAAREWWGSENPIGRRIRRWTHEQWSEVVGVIADAPLAGRQDAFGNNGRDVLFLHDQDPQPYFVFLMRTRTESDALALQASETIHAYAPELPVYQVGYMSEIVADQEQMSRSTAMLGMIFASAALLLVAVGVYGVLSHMVKQKALEISLRKALGASTARILREVSLPALSVLLAGCAAGLGTAWVALPRWLGSTLYEADPTQPLIYVGTVLILVGATMPALLKPATAGSKKDPADVLRGSARP